MMGIRSLCRRVCLLVCVNMLRHAPVRETPKSPAAVNDSLYVGDSCFCVHSATGRGRRTPPTDFRKNRSRDMRERRNSFSRRPLEQIWQCAGGTQEGPATHNLEGLWVRRGPHTIARMILATRPGRLAEALP